MLIFILSDFKNLPANMLRARVTKSKKLANAKIFMVVADDWTLFDCNINLQYTDQE